MSNDGSLALVSYLSSGYSFASVLRCVGLVSFSAIPGAPIVAMAKLLFLRLIINILCFFYIPYPAWIGTD